MPIVLHHLIPANNGLPGYGVAKELARQTVAQFGPVRFVGVGIAGGSCCAAVAVNPNAGAGFGDPGAVMGFGPHNNAIFGAAVNYGVVTGNSQLAAGGLDLGPLGGHAERAALTGTHGALTLYTLPPATNDAVLFVELEPCGACQTWLNGGGGGVANPFNGTINGAGAITLHVWWRWAYPAAGSIAAMNAFHNSPLATQLVDINTNW